MTLQPESLETVSLREFDVHREAIEAQRQARLDKIRTKLERKQRQHYRSFDSVTDEAARELAAYDASLDVALEKKATQGAIRSAWGKGIGARALVSRSYVADDADGLVEYVNVDVSEADFRNDMLLGIIAPFGSYHVVEDTYGPQSFSIHRQASVIDGLVKPDFEQGLIYGNARDLYWISDTSGAEWINPYDRANFYDVSGWQD